MFVNILPSGGHFHAQNLVFYHTTQSFYFCWKILQAECNAKQVWAVPRRSRFYPKLKSAKTMLVLSQVLRLSDATEGVPRRERRRGLRRHYEWFCLNTQIIALKIGTRRGNCSTFAIYFKDLEFWTRVFKVFAKLIFLGKLDVFFDVLITIK